MGQHQTNFIVPARRLVRALLVVGALTASVGSASCGLLDPELADTGTVVFNEVEGGCWGIQTSTELYNPLNLPATMRIDGLEVQWEGQVLLGRTSFCPGTIIELTWIDEL